MGHSQVGDSTWGLFLRAAKKAELPLSGAAAVQEAEDGEGFYKGVQCWDKRGWL